MTGQILSDAVLTTDINGMVDLSFTMQDEEDVSYNDFLVLVEFKNGEVFVESENTTGIVDESCPNKVTFYKLYRVVADGSGNRDISDANTGSGIPDAYNAINSACDSIVFDPSITWGDFHDYYINNADGDTQNIPDMDSFNYNLLLVFQDTVNVGGRECYNIQ